MNMKKFTSILVYSMPVLFPLLAVWLIEYVYSVSLNKPFQFDEELGPRIMRTLIASFPFVVVAIMAMVTFKKNPPQKMLLAF